MPFCKTPEHRSTFKKYKHYKQNSSCISCGESEYNKLEFHHLCYDDGEGGYITGKWAAVSSMVRENYAWEDVKDELDKCVPLCKDCHTDYHKNLNRELNA